MDQWTLRFMLASLLLLCGCAAGTVPPPSVQLMATNTAVSMPSRSASNQASQTSTISICTETDGGLTGTFSFSSSAFTETQMITIVAGAMQPVCGPLIQILAGTVAVTEVPALGTMLAGVRTLPESDVIRIMGSTATFMVMASNPELQTLIIFRNRPDRSSRSQPLPERSAKKGSVAKLHSVS